MSLLLIDRVLAMKDNSHAKTGLEPVFFCRSLRRTKSEGLNAVTLDAKDWISALMVPNCKQLVAV
ncbi:hypothetical protein [Plesiomonas shigelloides]|uniref:hypothetical protein n=1 Tax=Plesiomonas shigelloides TaxID=703 RepID=UPI001262ABF3|nr:hypothetical protein [Plesiomonas shigelloides]KAB7685836.1 hypothetical protein GBN20_12555 [Plesiomonas shigelloides]